MLLLWPMTLTLACCSCWCDLKLWKCLWRCYVFSRWNVSLPIAELKTAAETSHETLPLFQRAHQVCIAFRSWKQVVAKLRLFFFKKLSLWQGIGKISLWLFVHGNGAHASNNGNSMVYSLGCLPSSTSTLLSHWLLPSLPSQSCGNKTTNIEIIWKSVHLFFNHGR